MGMLKGEGGGTRRRAPWPLLIGFGVFVVAMGYLVAASFTRRSAPTFAPTAEGRVRAAGWERGGDTVTVDARDGDAWRYVSLERGQPLPPADTAGWEIAVRRYNLVANGDVVDLGPALFDTVGGARGVAEANSSTVGRWYRYSLFTHLLESTGNVYLLRARTGRPFKIQVVSYYCPGLAAGCLTLRYAPLAAE